MRNQDSYLIGNVW